MAKQTINIGASPNDGTGTPLRTSFDYCNQNFTELYTATGPSGNNIVVPGSATITGDLTAGGNSTLGSASKSTNTNLNFSSDLGTQRIYLDRGGRSLVFLDVTSNIENYRIAGITGVHTWGVGGSTAMTLNSTGLGVGASPVVPLHIYSGGTGTTDFGNVVATFRTGASGRAVALQFSDTSNIANIGMLSGALQFAAGGSTKQMTLDTSGNVGVGVTPSAWRTSVPFKVFQIGYTGAMYGLGSTEQINITSNYLQNTAGNEVRIQAGYVTRYQQSSGQHIWSYAGTDAAGSGFTLTQAMTLNAAGSLVLGAAAVATTATDGFLYIPGCAGTPTGTPTAQTGRVPLVVDTTNNKLYFYSGGSWVAAN